MPVTVRLDDANLDALVTWLGEQIDGADEPQRSAHAELLALFQRNLRQHSSGGTVARSGVRLLATAYRENTGYLEAWRP